MSVSAISEADTQAGWVSFLSEWIGHRSAVTWCDLWKRVKCRCARRTA